MCGKIFARYVIHWENAVFGSGLYGHIAYAETVVHGKGGDIAGKFQRFIQRAVHTDKAYKVQDNILARNPRGEAAGKDHLNGAGDLEPCGARCHAGGKIGGADARGKGAQRAVGAGVGIGAYYAVAGGNKPLLGQEGVLDAAAPHLIVVRDVHFACKIPHFFGLRRAFYILIRGEVIRYKHDFFRVVRFGQIQPVELIDGHGSGYIVAQHKVKAAGYKLIRRYGVKPCLAGQQLLRHGHCHSVYLPLIAPEISLRARFIASI